MHRQEQNVFLLCEAQQLDAQQWTTRQIKWRLDLFCRRALRLGFALVHRQCGEVFYRESKQQTRRDHLRRSAVLARERRAQSFVTFDDLVETLFERGYVELAGKTHGCRQIVESAVRLQLIEEP
jgi:hypothetical protein